MLAPGPCSLPPSSSAQGDVGLGSFKGREKNQLPPSFGFCGACRIPAGCLLGKFSLFLGELSVASCKGGSSHPLF